MLGEMVLHLLYLANSLESPAVCWRGRVVLGAVAAASVEDTSIRVSTVEEEDGGGMRLEIGLMLQLLSDVKAMVGSLVLPPLVLLFTREELTTTGE